MSTDDVLDRLQINNSEITGIVRSFRLAPSALSVDEDLPCLFVVRPMGMPNPIPRTSPGRYNVGRRYLMRLLIAPATTASVDNDDEGLKILTDAVPFLDYVIDYYADHPRLHTETMGELDLSDDMSIQDRDGIVGNLLGPDGATYVGAEFIVTIEEQRINARSFS